MPARPSNGEQAELCNNWLLSLGPLGLAEAAPDAHLPRPHGVTDNLAISLAHGGTTNAGRSRHSLGDDPRTIAGRCNHFLPPRVRVDPSAHPPFPDLMWITS